MRRSRRARVSRPLILLAAEPTGQLDSATARSVMDLIGALVRSEGAAAIVATHDPLLMECADRVVELHDGRLSPAPTPVPPGSHPDPSRESG